MTDFLLRPIIRILMYIAKKIVGEFSFSEQLNVSPPYDGVYCLEIYFSNKNLTNYDEVFLVIDKIKKHVGWPSYKILESDINEYSNKIIIPENHEAYTSLKSGNSSITYIFVQKKDYDISNWYIYPDFISIGHSFKVLKFIISHTLVIKNMRKNRQVSLADSQEKPKDISTEAVKRNNYDLD